MVTTRIPAFGDQIMTPKGASTHFTEKGPKVYNLLLSQNTTGLPLPDWDLPSDLERMQELSDFTLTLMFNSREKHRLTAGDSHIIVCSSQLIMS